MAVTAEPLGPTQLPALRALLTKDPAHNLYLLGLLEEFGLTPDPGAPFEYWGGFKGDELVACVFVGGGGGLVIPNAGPMAAITDIARALHGKVRMRSCIGEKPLVDVLQQHLGGRQVFSKTQRLFSVSADDLGPFTNPMLRLATEDDVPQVLTMAAEAVRELLHRDPLIEDPDGFSARVVHRIRAKRTYVYEEKGQLVFKLDLGPRSQNGAELEGLYTIPSERKKGHATLCLGQISRFLLSSLPRLTVRVDDENPSFAGIARKVGYLAGRAQRFVVME